MSLALANRVEILHERAAMLAKARDFFAERGVLEVDVPILSHFASIDVNIDLIQATYVGKKCFLHSSPEYGMKRLLAEGSGDIFQLSHVFREGERGSHHNPEFMMAEWYRLGFSFEEMITETINFVRLFVDAPGPVEELSYRAAFQKYGGISLEEVEEKDLFFSLNVQPNLGCDGITVILDFPAAEAALAQTRLKEGEMVAERFEIFHKGFELSNGYHELIDPVEQQKRFDEENKERVSLGKEAYPTDPHFLAALEKGIPECCGVAVGFDRLMMLRLGVETIDEVVAFGWDHA